MLRFRLRKRGGRRGLDIARRICTAALCTVLAACALPKPVPLDTADGDVYARIGRFALRVETATGRQDAVQGGFAWRDDGLALQLDLANPLGTTLARVDVDRNGAVLTRFNGAQTMAANPDALVAQALGSDFPVAGLRDWLRGRLADERVNDVQRDGEGRPERFVQDGWQVRLSRYDALGPRLLRIERRQADELIDVRLVID